MLIDQTRTRDHRPSVIAGIAIVAAVISLTVAACTTVSAQNDPPSSSSSAGRPTGSSHSGPPDAEDGVLPDHTSAYDTSLPGIARLDPALRKAVQQA